MTISFYSRETYFILYLLKSILDASEVNAPICGLQSASSTLKGLLCLKPTIVINQKCSTKRFGSFFRKFFCCIESKLKCLVDHAQKRWHLSNLHRVSVVFWNVEVCYWCAYWNYHKTGALSVEKSWKVLAVALIPGIMTKKFELIVQCM